MRPFRFKQFIVMHGKAGLKVGVDSVLFGALVNRHEFGSSNPSGALHIADVGTGSGLLALMLRQGLSDSGRSGKVVAIELDEAACEDAAANVAASPWSDSIEVHQSSWQQFAGVDAPYDLIVSNPPFFPRPPTSTIAASAANRYKLLGKNQQALSPEPTPDEVWPLSRARARFSNYLPLPALFAGADEWLTPQGSMWLLHARQCEEEAVACARERGLRLRRCIRVEFKAGQGPKRSILHFQKGDSGQFPDLEEQHFQVRDEKNLWTEEFIDLAQRYYSHNMREWAG